MKYLVATINHEDNTLEMRFETNEDVRAAYKRIDKDPEPVQTQSVTVEDIRPAIRALLNTGYKIHAIKLYRVVTHQGLKESKDAVEAIGEGPLGYS